MIEDSKELSVCNHLEDINAEELNLVDYYRKSCSEFAAIEEGIH